MIELQIFLWCLGLFLLGFVLGYRECNKTVKEWKALNEQVVGLLKLKDDENKRLARRKK